MRSASRIERAGFAAIVVALIAAASTFVLPAFDFELPGGSLPWQLGALAVAVLGATWGPRQLGAMQPKLPGFLAWPVLGRRLAHLALLVALLWVAGVAVLWLVWPR